MLRKERTPRGTYFSLRFALPGVTMTSPVVDAGGVGGVGGIGSGGVGGVGARLLRSMDVGMGIDMGAGLGVGTGAGLGRKTGPAENTTNAAKTCTRTPLTFEKAG